jgi:hypothetical protein
VLDRARQLAPARQAPGHRGGDAPGGREGTEIAALFTTLAEHGAVRHFATVVRGEFGAVDGEVEEGGVDPDDATVAVGDDEALGHRLDHVERPRAAALFTTLAEHGAVRHFATVVRGEFGAVDEVEVAAVSRCTAARSGRWSRAPAPSSRRGRRARSCARPSAAVSRQGFYAKMRRYGLGDLDGSEEPDDADA